MNATCWARRGRVSIATVAVVALGYAGVGLAGPAGGAGIVVKPSSNLKVGLGAYLGAVSAAKNAFPQVPNPSAAPLSRTASTKLASLSLTGPVGTFTLADKGRFVEDGAGGRLPDGVEVVELTPLVPVYPRQGLAFIKTVNLTGTTATLSQKAIAAGTGPVTLIEPAPQILLITQASGSIPFLAPIPNGLCLTPVFPSGLCEYSAGNLAHNATKLIAFANADGSVTATPFTISEGVMDGGLGAAPGPIYAKVYDPDGDGPAPTAPFAVPSSVSGSTPRGCAPDVADRSIPNPLIGGIDYCTVTAVGLNAGVQTTFVPFVLSAVPLTWAASAGGFVAGPHLVITGHDFANNDIIVKVIVSNAKAKLSTDPLIKCPALNQTLTGLTANSTGGVLAVVSDFGLGCTVPPTSITRVTISGSKDVQQSQIPPNAVIGTSLPKRGVGLITMTPAP